MPNQTSIFNKLDFYDQNVRTLLRVTERRHVNGKGTVTQNERGCLHKTLNDFHKVITEALWMREVQYHLETS
jgi:hypothetical protein